MLAISQNPDRVSNIFWSSTLISRDVGSGLGGGAVLRGLLDSNGGHAAAPSRWVSAVSSRNISSRPAPSAGRSSVSAHARGERDLADQARIGICAKGAVAQGRRDHPGLAESACQLLGVGAADQGAGGLQQVVLGAVRDYAAVADHDDVVGDHLDLVQKVRGEQHRAAAVREAPQQVAHPSDAAGVESVGGLVEDQDLGVPDQCGRDAQSLAHAERVVADPAIRPRYRSRLTRSSISVDASSRQPHGALRDRENLPARAARMLRRRVEQDTDLHPGVGQFGVPTAGDRGVSRRRRGEPDHDSHGRGLAGAVGAEEPGHPTWVRGEADVVDGSEARRTSWRGTRL